MDTQNILILMNFGMKSINCSKNIKLPFMKEGHGTYHYLPFAITVKELIEQVKQRKHNITALLKE